MGELASRFLAICESQRVLGFGAYTLKSGRKSPYFFNLGRVSSGTALARVGECYAEAIVATGIRIDTVFGPAYKGIPLAVATSLAMDAIYGRDLPFAFNRKESKSHGEGGRIVGQLEGRVAIVDDVLTAGTAVREAVELVRAAGAEPALILVALDREERGPRGGSALAELGADVGVPTYAIARFTELLAHARKSLAPEQVEQMERYRAEFGLTI